MLKQSFSKIKKVLTILLAALFVVALTATAVSASLFTEQSAVLNTESQSHHPEKQHSPISHDNDLPKLVIDKAQTALVVIRSAEWDSLTANKALSCTGCYNKCNKASECIQEKWDTSIPCASHNNKRDDAQCHKR